jgi:hypothetical protein
MEPPEHPLLRHVSLAPGAHTLRADAKLAREAAACETDA